MAKSSTAKLDEQYKYLQARIEHEKRKIVRVMKVEKSELAHLNKDLTDVSDNHIQEKNLHEAEGKALTKLRDMLAEIKRLKEREEKAGSTNRRYGLLYGMLNSLLFSLNGYYNKKWSYVGKLINWEKTLAPPHLEEIYNHIESSWENLIRMKTSPRGGPKQFLRSARTFYDEMVKMLGDYQKNLSEFDAFRKKEGDIANLIRILIVLNDTQMKYALHFYRKISKPHGDLFKAAPTALDKARFHSIEKIVVHLISACKSFHEKYAGYSMFNPQAIFKGPSVTDRVRRIEKNIEVYRHEEKRLAGLRDELRTYMKKLEDLTIRETDRIRKADVEAAGRKDITERFLKRGG